MKHRPRKRFGQHFLTSPDVIDRIVQAIAPRQGETLVEIGPGRAAITDPLAELASDLHAIEFDRDLVAQLKAHFAAVPSVTIHEADALEFDFGSLGRELRIVGNLPYNISTPLLFHLLEFRDHILDTHFMLQKEVVQRMEAAPGSKDFGRLTVMLGCRMETVSLFDVAPDAFSPPPAVTSTVVRMRPRSDTALADAHAEALADIVRLAFSRRRKTLRNALRGSLDDGDIEAAGLDPSIRPEQVPISGWLSLASRVDERNAGKTYP